MRRKATTALALCMPGCKGESKGGSEMRWYVKVTRGRLSGFAVLLALSGSALTPLAAQTAIKVDGEVESTSGGFKFPDGTVQTSASNDAAVQTQLIQLNARTACPLGMSRTGAWCIDDVWSSPAEARDSIRSCSASSKSVCSLEALTTCDADNHKVGSEFPDSCGNKTDAGGSVTIRTLTHDHVNGAGAAISLIGYKGNETLVTLGNLDTENYYCCTPAPTVRYSDLGDGTVLDNNTGLLWLKDASCGDLAGTNADGTGDWTVALAAAAALAEGTCGLTDGSAPGDWRLPTISELCSAGEIQQVCPAANVRESLVNSAIASSPKVANAQGSGAWSEGDAFVGVQNSAYWSATEINATDAWDVFLFGGNVFVAGKVLEDFVWPVRSRE